MKKFKYDISVIVPVYNNEEYIDECVNSILNQKFNIDRIQIILINDGSKDNSLEVMKKYKRDNILIIDKKNTGVSDTRNLGMQKALGKYILFLDSDDSISTNTCNKLFSLFEKHYDEIDLITYPIIYNINGKLKPHVRYDNMFFKGTGIYDLKENYNLIQTTVNICIKNNFENNILFDVKQNFSEDERFATETLMKKMKIGFCKEASYYYRRHVGTANDTITNAYYSFETINSYYEYLFDKYEENGHVPKYIQTLYVNNVSWRIKKDDLYPYHYNKKDFDIALKRIKNLLKKVDVDVIISLPYLSKFHQMYILKLKEEKVKIDVHKDNSYTILCKDNILVEEDRIRSLVNRFKVKNNEIILNGNFQTLAFEVVDPIIYLSTIDKNNCRKDTKIETYITNSSYHASKIKTNLIYGYKLKINLDEVKEFNMYAVINNIQIPIHFIFNRFTSRKIYYSKKRIAYTKKRFKITKNNLYYRLKDNTKNFLTYIKKNPRIVAYRLLAKTYIKKRPIWLYSDKGGLVDNAYIQFKHDIKKKDGITRYYVYNEPYSKIKDKFTVEEQKHLLKFKSLKHKKLFIRCDKILTSFSDLQVYCPFNTGIKWYRDIIKYDLIYLQHGILHANLIDMYSKEFTEISKFVISSNFEENNLISKYNYDKEDFIKSGMPRMSLINDKIEVKNKILYAPSWRKYLIGNLVNNKRKLKTREFLASSYFKANYNLLHSKELNELLEKNNIILDFKLHPIFKEYGPLFELDNCPNIKLSFDKTVIEEYKLFITDFSSFQFDFVALKRPIIYFVPDMDCFKAGLHTYRKLDLAYEDAFGKLCLTSDELLDEMKTLINQNFKMKPIYKKRMDNFFEISKNPCEKIYKEIKK